MALTGILREDTLLGRKLCLNQGENDSTVDWNLEGVPGTCCSSPDRHFLEVAFKVSNVFKCVTPRMALAGLGDSPYPPESVFSSKSGGFFFPLGHKPEHLRVTQHPHQDHCAFPESPGWSDSAPALAAS